MSGSSRSQAKVASASPLWVTIVGGALLGTTLLFLMGLVAASVFGRELPCSSRFMVVAILAFTAGAGSSFLGGTAAAKGAIPWTEARKHPISFAVTGGVAVLIIMLVLGTSLYANNDCVDQLGPALQTRVHGRVVGDDQRTLERAQLSIPGVVTAEADSDGTFTLNLDGVTSNVALQLTVEVQGYQPFKKSIDVHGGTVELGDMQLRRSP